AVHGTTAKLWAVRLHWPRCACRQLVGVDARWRQVLHVVLYVRRGGRAVVHTVLAVATAVAPNAIGTAAIPVHRCPARGLARGVGNEMIGVQGVTKIADPQQHRQEENDDDGVLDKIALFPPQPPQARCSTSCEKLGDKRSYDGRRQKSFASL